jgi:hypothetical protein
MPRKRKRRTVAAQAVQPFAWLEATRPDPGGLLAWPTLDPRHEISPGEQNTIYRAARSLSYNSTATRMLLEKMQNLLGWQVPQPCTPDKEWNKLAKAHFDRIAMNPAVFDNAGCLNFITAQLWLEYNRAIDGDALAVATNYNGYASFSFYRAAQVTRDGINLAQGVETSPTTGRALAYWVHNSATGKATRVPAWAAWLYRHQPEPGMTRGVSDLVGGVITAKDSMELVGHVKAAAKLQAALGVYEYKRLDDAAPGAAGAFMAGKKLVDAQGEERLNMAQIMGGATISSLAPGRELKVLADTRPGPNTLQFLDKLEDQLSDSAGLDNNAVFNLGNANSANVRLILENNRGWREKRHQWARPMLHWMYRYVLAAEIAAGRLPLPKEGTFDQVEFIPCRDMTIDWGRVATAAINLKREGLLSAKDFVQSAWGKTLAEIAEDNAEMLATFRQLEEKYGLAPGSLQQAALGATDVNRPQPAEG